MKIRNQLRPSGITEGIQLLVEAQWTSEQALAVVDLLDDLREHIVRQYMLQIHANYQNDRASDGSPRDADPEIDGEPF